MKRTVGALVLLAGLSGCLSFPPKGDPADKKTTAVKPTASPTAGMAPGTYPVSGGPMNGVPVAGQSTYRVPAPTYASWGPAPGVPGGMPNGVPNGMPTGMPNGMPGGMPNGVAAGMPEAHSVARMPDPTGMPSPAGGMTLAAGGQLPPPGPPPGHLPMSMADSLFPPVVTPPSVRPSATPVVQANATQPGSSPAQAPVVLTLAGGGERRGDSLHVLPMSYKEEPEQSPSLPATPLPPSLPSALPPPPQSPVAGSGGRGLDTLPPTPTLQKELSNVVDRSGRLGAPMVRLVNSRQITLNFEVKDVGPSGLAGMELWATQDCKSWKKYDAPPAQSHTYNIEVDEEGMYGFTLVARSGTGMAKEPPAPGEQPQVWVIVDMTKPSVQLGELSAASAAGGGQTVTIRWKASDRNLARQPISLYYGERPEGPWKPIAANLDNTGLYNWQTPAGLPARFLVRVDAADMAGNIGSSESSHSITLDASVPRPIIVDVAPR